MDHSLTTCLNGISKSELRSSPHTQYRVLCHSLMSLRNLLLVNSRLEQTLKDLVTHSRPERGQSKHTKPFIMVKICQSISSTLKLLTLLSSLCSMDLVCQSCTQWPWLSFLTKDFAKESKLPITIDSHQLWMTP